jgi:tRNA threonylcarbamoyladenosine modification (KEOPS) complex  Pcc1 subunit
MKTNGSLEVKFPNDKALEAAIKAISHEGDVGNRSTTKITKKDSTLKLEIEADDAVAFRATVNAYLRALQVIEGLEKGVQK